MIFAMKVKDFAPDKDMQWYWPTEHAWYEGNPAEQFDWFEPEDVVVARPAPPDAAREIRRVLDDSCLLSDSQTNIVTQALYDRLFDADLIK